MRSKSNIVWTVLVLWALGFIAMGVIATTFSPYTNKPDRCVNGVVERWYYLWGWEPLEVDGGFVRCRPSCERPKVEEV